MCVSVIPPQETGGSASGNWLRAALTRLAAAAGFAPGINEPHHEYKSSAASHLTSRSSTLRFPAFVSPHFPTLDIPPTSTCLILALTFALSASFQRRFPPRPLLSPPRFPPNFREPACLNLFASFHPPLPPSSRPLSSLTLTPAPLLQSASRVLNSSSDLLARSESRPFLPCCRQIPVSR
jgi:hypothetical protein